jgi:hypothetical protein
LKIRIQFAATEASASVHDLSDRADALDEPLRTFVAPLAALVALEDARTDDVIDHLTAFLEEFRDADGDIESAEDDDGNVLEGSLEGELGFVMEDALDTRSHTWRRGNALLDLLARASRLTLTEVRYRVGQRTADVDEVAEAIHARSRAYGFEFTSLEARVEALDAEEDGDEDDGDEDDGDEDDGADGDGEGGFGGGWRSDDDDDEDEDDEDDDEARDASTPLDDEGFPRGGWGRAAGPGAAAPRSYGLTADERFYLELAGLQWPCSAAEVRAARARTLAKRHPDPHEVMAPEIAATRTEEFKRLQLGCNALLARCQREGRA